MNGLKDRPASVSDEWATSAKAGDSGALTLLVERHKPWIMKMAARSLNNHADAEDTTQEVLWRMVRYIRSFAGKSKFRTWLYRIAINCVIDSKKSQIAKNTEVAVTECTEENDRGFHPVAADLPGDFQLMVKEAKSVRMTATLLCLEGRQRQALMLAENLQVDHKLGAAVMRVSRANYRQLVTRARQDLEQFLNGECSLMSASGTCQCPRKTARFKKLGYLAPGRPEFSSERLDRVRRASEDYAQRLDRICLEYEQGDKPSAAPGVDVFLEEVLARNNFKEIVEL
jgi:RNA polymerase sigma factor (sigma-70 family)